MSLFEVGPLPEQPLDAAARFHAETLPGARDALEAVPAADASGHLAIVFQPAGAAHRGWRLAVVQDLARAAAPRRVNGLVGADPAAIAEAVAFLEAAPAVTGQLLAVDGKTAETS